MSLINSIRVNVLGRFIDLRYLSRKQTPDDEIIRIELLVAMCLLSLMCGVSYLVIGLFVNLSLLNTLNYVIFFSIVPPACLYLIKKGHHNIAKLAMMFLGTFFMLVKASALGSGSGMNMSMLIILFATFAFYSIRDYWYILLSVSLTLGSILFLELTHYSFLGTDTTTIAYEYKVNYAATILFCILFFYVILRVNQHINSKLIRLNTQLNNKNNQLIKMNEEMDSYVYKASHDMRAPVTSLMGIINLIKTETDPASIQKLVAMQENCVEKLDNHIRQIIDLSRNVKTDVTIEKIDVRSMTETIFAELSFFEFTKSIKRTITIKQEEDFYSDPYRLNIILNNLISNSFKYVRKDEPNPWIEFEAVVSPSFITVNIKDNGIGIHEDYQSKIFDMFYRATDQSKGSGLGLYIVKEMVQRLNGAITVDSVLNQYTHIMVVIPNSDPPADTLPLTSPAIHS